MPAPCTRARSSCWTELGLAAPIIERGRRVEKIAFYDGATRQAEVKLSELGGPFPFMVILPQNVFEDALEQRLRKAGVAVNWNHRFNDLQSDAGHGGGHRRGVGGDRHRLYRAALGSRS